MSIFCFSDMTSDRTFLPDFVVQFIQTRLKCWAFSRILIVHVFSFPTLLSQTKTDAEKMVEDWPALYITIEVMHFILVMVNQNVLLLSAVYFSAVGRSNPSLRCVLMEMNRTAEACSCSPVQTFTAGGSSKMLTKNSIFKNPTKDNSMLVCAGDEASQSTMVGHFYLICFIITIFYFFLSHHIHCSVVFL